MGGRADHRFATHNRHPGESRDPSCRRLASGSLGPGFRRDGGRGDVRRSGSRMKPNASETGDKLLLTPGPLTTSAGVKAAMQHDWGSRDAEFLRINRMVLERIAALAGGTGTHVTVPVQG